MAAMRCMLTVRGSSWACVQGLSCIPHKGGLSQLAGRLQGGRGPDSGAVTRQALEDLQARRLLALPG